MIEVKERKLKGKQNLTLILDNFVSHLKEKKLSSSTIYNYKAIILKLFEKKDYDITDISEKDIQGNVCERSSIKNLLIFLNKIEVKPESNEIVKAFRQADLYILNIGQSTLNTYSKYIKQLLKMVNNKPENITKEIIEKWIEGNKANSIKAKLAALEKFMIFSGLKLDFDLNRLKPSKRQIQNIQTENMKESYLTNREVKILTNWLSSVKNEITDIDSFNNLKDKCIVLLGLECGLRIMSVPEIRVANLDFERHQLMVTEKGQKLRFVTLNSKVEQFLKEYIRVMRLAKDDYVVNKNGRKYTIAGINGRVSLLFKELGIKTKDRNVSFHKLRHTYACNLYNDDVPLDMIQVELGQSKLETTQIYAKINDKNKKKYLRKSRVKYK